MHAGILQRLPVVGRPRQFSAHARLHDGDVVVDEGRLDVGDHVELREFLQERPVCDLAMHDGMPKIRFRTGKLRGFDRAHGHVRRAAADAVHRSHHAALLRRQDKLIQLFLRKNGDALRGRIVGIRSRQVRRASAQRTVRHQFERPDAEHRRPLSGIVALCEELLQQRLGSQQTLFEDADFQQAFVFQLMIGVQYLLILSGRQSLEVVSLHLGDAGLHQFVHAVFQHAPDIFHRQVRQRFVDGVAGSFAEDAQRLPVFVLIDVAAEGIFRVPRDPHHFQRFGIHDDDVAAGPGERHGDVRRDAVQVVAGRKAPFLPVFLVPAPALQPGEIRSLRKEVLCQGHEIVDAAGAVEIHLFQAVSIAQQVHVGIRESGQHGLSLQVGEFGLFRLQRQDLFVAAYALDDAVLHRDGALRRPSGFHRVDYTVIENRVHKVPPSL